MALLMLASYCYLCFQEEQRWLAVKARQITDQASAHTQRERIMALRDYLRRHVKWRGAAYDDRPFLRATARETLESGLGYCGESTRAFINLAHQLGIKAHRVNLYGPSPHVIAEAEVRPDVDILVDAQDSPLMNAYFDRRDWTLDEAIRDPGAPFLSYSNIHLRRVPILNQYLSQVKTCRRSS
jgi:transglutaminase superfamily protein